MQRHHKINAPGKDEFARYIIHRSDVVCTCRGLTLCQITRARLQLCVGAIDDTVDKYIPRQDEEVAQERPRTEIVIDSANLSDNDTLSVQHVLVLILIVIYV